MRGPMRMEHFLGMRFWRWRLSPIWKVELMGTVRASMWIERQVVRKYIWLLAGTKVSWVKPTALSESTTPGWCPHFSISFRQEQGDRFFWAGACFDCNGFSGRDWVCCARGWRATWRRSRTCLSFWASVRRRWSGGKKFSSKASKAGRIKSEISLTKLIVKWPGLWKRLTGWETSQ